jgi:hypothetical protein
MDKTLRRVTDLDEQQAETYRYWQSQSIGARMIAVSELSQAAYAFAAAFKLDVKKLRATEKST